MALKNTLRTRENTDIVFLKALLKISYAFSTAPYYDFGKKEVRRFRFYSFYSICTLSLIIGGFLYSAIFIKEDSGSGSQSEQISKFLQMVTALLLAIAASMAASSPLYMSDKWQYLLQQLQNINVKLGYWERESSENTKKIFALLFLVFLPIVCKDIYCFIAYIHNAASVVPKYFICNTIFECYCFVPTVLMVLLGIILKDKYETVLELLKYSKNNCNAGVFTKKSGYINIDELFNDHATYDNYLRRIAKLFRLLNSILENYNLVFGYQMLFMLGYTLLSVLETFDYCLKYKQLSSGDSFNPLLANLCITGFNLVKCTAIIISCDITTRKAGNLMDICYDLEEDLPSSSAERKEVLKLVRLARYKRPYFSAADFFNVDRKTLFGFLNVTTTYFIIIIQFNQSE